MSPIVIYRSVTLSSDMAISVAVAFL